MQGERLTENGGKQSGADGERYQSKIVAAGYGASSAGYDASLNTHNLGPGEPALAEWKAAGLRLPDLAAARAFRLRRVRDELRRRDLAGIVLFDPLNIRYATDSTNMQLWIAHNAARYCFVAADGPLIVFDYHGCEHLSAHNPLVDEVRPATSWFYFSAGERVKERAQKWADEIADLIRLHGGGNKRLAADRCNPEGAAALARRGISVANGEAVMENARLIKCEEEIQMLRLAGHSCEQAVKKMHAALRPGISENELWAILHSENIIRGGEWIETRLLASGPRTNPWFQESSSRLIQAGELLAFDTDLVGAFGMCVDISRTWLCGGGKPNDNQREVFDRARAQIAHNLELIKPGRMWREIVGAARDYPPDSFLRYSCLFHGVGLCDEFPLICFADEWDEAGNDGELRPGMVVCVESYVGKKSGGEGVKLEEQVAITDAGAELLFHYPLDL